MTNTEKKFPLSLSSVVDSRSAQARQTATPQTALKNLARGESRAAPVNSVPKTVAARGNSGHSGSGLSPAVAHGNPHGMGSDKIRHAMVARVAQQGVQDALVLDALAAIPRHLFIESGLSSQAYIDASLPIGHHQTISQPYIVARMMELMRNGRALQHVLEIGTGCGYQAAVLSLVAKQVYSIERIKALHELAKENLRPMRIANIRLHYGDGMLGLPQVAPFDGIILAAAGLEVPQALLMQLAVGGRLIAPVGSRSQVLQLTERISKDEWATTTVEACHFVPLRAGVI
ncbi:MAG: protein-L-isoaspartate(D-aspartate) O-methyltransferase [Burkholderiales bacterium]|nr:protein-L-isoaspartate(D-aspartate) O-methyltransferase [Burkholderiales bacterium]